ncbi:hypothetical protein [Lichenibacterium dinghuense]|uniref:hypothetical protein n=1 Tax=Lichenibacterium dinghuense TaxID=2895977 RepID=UPI001F26AD0C|nr:hypothetical protein [Lichenibacterium sp. 6Y81]
MWPGSASPQRETMCELFRKLGDEQEAVCLAYMEAERDGRVARPRGAEDMTPGTHARTLWREGKLKGWLAR